MQTQKSTLRKLITSRASGSTATNSEVKKNKFQYNTTIQYKCRHKTCIAP